MKVLTAIFIIDAVIGICLASIGIIISPNKKMEKLANISYKIGMIMLFIALFIFLTIGLLLGILMLQDALT